MRPRTSMGELWLLDEHRLFVGDATKRTDMDALLDGKRIDLWLTDPPYNVDYHGGGAAELDMQHDAMSDAAFNDFLVGAFQLAAEALKPGGVFYVWHADTNRKHFISALETAGLNIRQALVWIKNTPVLGRQDYHWKHEPCLYGWKGGAEHYFTFDRTQAGVIEEKDLSRMSRRELMEELQRFREGEEPTTVLRHPKPQRSEAHPTMKPVPLVGKLISNSSRSGEVVLDNFAGSGSTLIACEQLGRRCFCLEVDPRYADALIDRWETFTGREAMRDV